MTFLVSVGYCNRLSISDFIRRVRWHGINKAQQIAPTCVRWDYRTPMNPHGSARSAGGTRQRIQGSPIRLILESCEGPRDVFWLEHRGRVLSIGGPSHLANS